MSKITLNAHPGEISKGIEFIREVLTEKKVSKKEIAGTLLTAEEVLAKLIANSQNETDTVQVQVKSFLGNVRIHMSCRGDQFDIADLQSLFDYSDEMDVETEVVIRNLMNKVLGDNITISNKRHVNIADIQVKVSQYQQLIYTLLALGLGLLVGLVFKFFVPDFITAAISENIFASVSTMFLNSLKTIVAPLVFFSIASSIADFGDLKALGKIAGKVVGCYLFTSVIAITIGYLVYQMFPIGDPALVEAVSVDAASAISNSGGISVSIKDTIVNIIPTDYISPFLKADMLQIIFIGALLGLGASKLSDRDAGFRRAIFSANAVFSKITAIIISVMPYAVFCSMAKMVIDMNIGNLIKVAAWVPVCYIGDILMIAVYLILILAVARLNPLKFLKSFFPVMLTAFTLGSSNATMPATIKTCDEKLGISKKVYSFSIPLGATINMDGSCITQIISALFMAKVFGVTITGSTLVTLIVAILALSVGAPGVPGGCLVCISILLPQIGIPVEAISLIMGIYTLVGMGHTCTNVTGDAAVTTIVARSEGLVDLNKYNS